MTPPPFTRILVTSRTGATRLDMDAPYAVVSLNDPGDASPVRHRWGLCGVACLTFRDVGTGGPDAMVPAQARDVRDFLASLDTDVGTLVIHCFAGASRSISCAMAVADHFNLGRACIRWEAKPRGIHDDPPNAHVYGLVRAALAEGDPT